ncbi:MAG: beta-N-acetylhexosaminidase [Acidobacteria bacterium]|nr:beta-N-acetylhexosaminidase [Acidobacteriota bacterium]
MSPSGLRRQIGQLAFLGFKGTIIPAELRALAREFDIGGVVLFARNVEGPEQVAELAFDAARLVPDLPLWVAVDQEGGRVARMRRPFTEWPPMATLGRSGRADLAGRFGHALAREMRAVGISLDFAPVVDVLTQEKNSAIGDRALSSNPETVATLGAAIIDALQSEGVAACAKHFPGHGDTSVDSHHELPLVEHSPDRFDQVDFVPFRAAISAGVAAIMVAHLLVPAFDEDVPASLSRRVVTTELRTRLDFENLILTDDLGMNACSARFPPPVAAVKAVAAGHDGVLLCDPDPDQQAAALEALVHALEDGTLPYAQVESSVARHARLKATFVRRGDEARRPSATWREIVGCEAHQGVAAEMRAFA